MPCSALGRCRWKSWRRKSTGGSRRARLAEPLARRNDSSPELGERLAWFLLGDRDLEWSDDALRTGRLRSSLVPLAAMNSYSVFPFCSVLTTVTFPNNPSFSSLGPEVKKSSLKRPVVPLPKLSAQRLSIVRGLPSGLRIWPSCFPVNVLKA